MYIEERNKRFEEYIPEEKVFLAATFSKIHILSELRLVRSKIHFREKK